MGKVLNKNLIAVLGLTILVFVGQPALMALSSSKVQAPLTWNIETSFANLIKNPGFEQELDYWFSTGGTATYSSDSVHKHSGYYSAKGVESEKGNLGRLYQDMTDTCVPGKIYKIGGWIKTESVEGFVVIALNYVNSGGWTPPGGYVKEIGYVTGTQDWTYFESEEFTLPQMPDDCVALWFLFDFNNGKGTTWWDDVFLIAIQKFQFHFRINPFGNVFHVNVDASGWINGYMSGGYMDWNPVLGKVEGDRICMAIDLAPDGAPGNYQMLFLTAKVSTMTGQIIVTKDGMSYTGPLDVSITTVTGSEEELGADITEVTNSDVTPDAWYKFRLNPYTDIIHIKPNPGGWLNGYDEVGVNHYPILGFTEGDRWYFGIDGLDTPYTLIFNTGKLSTMSGKMIRTQDGTTYEGPTNIWVTFMASEGDSVEGKSALMP